MANPQKYPRPIWERRFVAVSRTPDTLVSLAPQGRTNVDAWCGPIGGAGATATFELWAIVGDVRVKVMSVNVSGLGVAAGALLMSAQGWCPDRWDLVGYATGAALGLVASSYTLNAWGA